MLHFSCDCHVQSNISHWISSGTRGRERVKLNVRGTGCLLSKVNQLPQSMSLSSQWVTNASNHFWAWICHIEYSLPTLTCAWKNILYNNPISLMGGCWLSDTWCSQNLVYFRSLPIFFFLSFCVCWSLQSPKHLSALSVCVYPYRQSHSFIRAAIERGGALWRDRVARCCIVLEAGWVMQDKSVLVVFERAHPWH